MIYFVFLSKYIYIYIYTYKYIYIYTRTRVGPFTRVGPLHVEEPRRAREQDQQTRGANNANEALEEPRAARETMTNTRGTEAKEPRKNKRCREQP